MNVNPKILFFKNLYGLLQEVSYAKSDKDVLEKAKNDPSIERHITSIKLLRAKKKAEVNKSHIENTKRIYNALIQNNQDALINLVGPKKTESLQILYNNFKGKSSIDDESVKDDSHFLLFLEEVNNDESED